MLYKDVKTMVCSPNGNTDYFDIVAGVSQRVTLAPYPFTICLDLHTTNVNRSNEMKMDSH